MNRQDIENRKYYDALGEIFILLSQYKAYKPNSKEGHLTFKELSDKFEKFYHEYLESES